MDGCQVSVRGYLNQLDDNGEEYSVAFFSKRLSPVEDNYSANDWKLLGRIYFLQRSRCYLEESELEFLADSQILCCFLSNPSLSCRQDRLLRKIRNHQTSTRERKCTCPRRHPLESAPDARKTDTHCEQPFVAITEVFLTRKVHTE